MLMFSLVLFFNDTATTEIYTLSLHDALPIFRLRQHSSAGLGPTPEVFLDEQDGSPLQFPVLLQPASEVVRKDRKSTRLNSSHANISYAVFCLKKKNRLLL